MSRIKINPGLACIILIACLFAGWATMLTVAVLMLIFCEVDENTKGLATTVLAFYIGLTLVSMGWGLIYDAIDLVIDAITKLIATINSYLEYDSVIDITKLQSYLFTPVSNLADIADMIVAYLLVFVKFGFIISLVSGKAAKDNFIAKKINEYVSKVVNYVNSLNFVNNGQPQQPQQTYNQDVTPTQNSAQ